MTMKGAFFDPGRLRHEMVLEEPARVADALGGHDVTWSAVATLWAELRPATAGPVNRADAEEAEITHRVVLRFDPRVWSGRRLRMCERIFAIRTVRDLDETGRYLVCRAQEKGL